MGTTADMNELLTGNTSTVSLAILTALNLQTDKAKVETADKRRERFF